MAVSGSKVTLAHVWQSFPALVLLGIVWGWSEIAPNDFWWHVRTGEIIFGTQQVPRVDLYTWTHAGEPWVNQAWLMQLGLHLLYRGGGAPLTLFVHGLLVVSGYVLLQSGLVQLTKGNGRLAAVLTMAAAVLGMQDWAVRPQSVSFLFFGLVLFLLVQDHRRPGGRLWWLPLIVLIWVNAHGAFVFGLVLVGSYVLDRLWNAHRSGQKWPLRRVFLPGLLAVTAVAINPVGPVGIIKYVLDFGRAGTQAVNFEFRPLSITTIEGLLFISWALIVIGVLVWKQYRPGVFEALVLVIFGLMALAVTRNLPWFGFVSAPVVAVALTRGAEPSPVGPPGHTVANVVLLVVLLGLVIVCLPWLRRSFPGWNARRGLMARDTPIGAVAYLREHLPPDARIFNEASYGSYVIWACPQLPIFIDTRFELYSLQEWLSYLAINGGRYDWQQLLDQRGVTLMLLRRQNQAPLISAATASPCWQEVYRDGISVVFLRWGCR
jgi:hypothetical protein